MLEIVILCSNLVTYWAVRQVIGRAFVCLLLELASWPSQSAELPIATAKLVARILPVSTQSYFIFYSFFLNCHPDGRGGKEGHDNDIDDDKVLCLSLRGGGRRRRGRRLGLRGRLGGRVIDDTTLHLYSIPLLYYAICFGKLHTASLCMWQNRKLWN